jgi:hypothetical protein
LRVAPDVVAIAQEVSEACQRRGAAARLLGGVAIYLSCPSAQRSELSRPYQDIDFVVRRASAQKFGQACQDVGFVPDRRFNSLHGDRRLLFSRGDLELDAFVDVFEQSQKLDFSQRLGGPGATISLADLLLTKLQIFEINEKDLKDVVTLLLDHPPDRSAQPAALRMQELERVLCGNWGFYATFMDNLDRVPRVAHDALPDAEAAAVEERVRTLREALAAAPKSLAWTARARIGRRMAWYEVPEEKSR